MVFVGYFNPPGYSSHGVVNTPEWRGAQVPSTNGHGSATGLARLYAAMVEPGRLLSPDLLRRGHPRAGAGPCPVLGEDVAFGLGLRAHQRRAARSGTNPRSASATSAPAARSASPTPTRSWASAT